MNDIRERFGALTFDDNDNLTGPCGCDYIHHGAVRIINRDKEDGDATRIFVDGKNVVMDRISSEQAPGRRDTIEIDLFCEQCGPVGVLSIMQHKGNTVFSYVDDDEKRHEERVKQWKQDNERFRFCVADRPPGVSQ